MRLVILDKPDEVALWVATYVKKRILAFNPTADRPFVLGEYLMTPRFCAGALELLRPTFAHFRP
jgi:hypothetical protein